MPFASFLKTLLVVFVDSYQKLFKKTFVLALILTVVCFLLAALLASYTDFDAFVRSKPISILSYFFVRYSYKGIYSFVDIVKSIFVFLVSIYSIVVIRNGSEAIYESKHFRFMATAKDIIYLIGILTTSIFLDCALFRLDEQILRMGGNHNVYLWAHTIIFQLRIYLPLVLFALIIQIRTSKAEFNSQKIIYLIVALWLCNEVAYEFTVAIRTYIFQLVLSPIKDLSTFYILESILGIGLVTLFFPGYYCAMTAPFAIVESAGDQDRD